MFGNYFGVEVDTAPANPMALNLQLSADGSEATGKTLVVEFAVAGDGSWTTLSSGTHYSVTELGNGIYWLTWDAGNAPALFDTEGAAVARITASDTTVRSHEIPFWIYDPADLPDHPAQMDSTNWAVGADTFWRRHAGNIEASSNGDSVSGGEVISGLTMMLERIGDTAGDASGLTKTIKKTDGSTTLLVISLTTGTGPSSPIVSQAPVTS